MITKDGIDVGEGFFACRTCKAEGVVHTDDGDAMPPGWLIVLDDWDSVVEVFCSQRCLAEWASTAQERRGYLDSKSGLLVLKGEA